MNLLSSIVLATILGFLLLLLGPIGGGLIAFGIVLGCLIRGLYLLNDISKRFSKVAPTALERYREEREKINQG